MNFSISKNIDGTWNLTPLSGTCECKTVATAEAIVLKHVRFQGKKLIGRVAAVWGAVVLLDEVYTDELLRHGLALRGVFKEMEGEPLELDYDGYHARDKKVVRTAEHVFINSHSIVAREFA
jgi:hypothetical protein